MDAVQSTWFILELPAFMLIASPRTRPSTKGGWVPGRPAEHLAMCGGQRHEPVLKEQPLHSPADNLGVLPAGRLSSTAIKQAVSAGASHPEAEWKLGADLEL